MAGQSIEIPIKLGGLAQIKSELRELKGELANATDPEQMQQLAQRAGELQDKLSDANEAVKNFASGSKFEQIGNSFGSMKDSIMSLDFEEASQKATMFSKSLTSLKPTDIGNSIKGLIGVVGQLGKAFVTFGLQLLANPIFLLVAVIVAVVVGLVLLANKLGLIKPILDAMSKAFDYVIQKLKDFADWLGLTNFAEEDKAKKSIESNRKIADSYKTKGEKIATAYDRQIEIAKIEGKNTTQLEIAKQKAIIQTAQLRQKALQQQLKDNAVSHSLDKDQIQKIQDGLKETKTLIEDSTYNVKKIKAQEASDNAKKNEEIAKNNKESAKQRQQQQIEYAKQRLETARQIEDTNIALMNEGVTKELKANETKYARLRADNLKNSKLTALERATIDLQLQEQEFNEKKNIQAKYNEETKQSLIASEKSKTDEKVKLEGEEKTRLEAVAKLKAETGKTAQELELQKIRADFEAKRLIAGEDSALLQALNDAEKKKLAETNDKFRKEEEDKEAKLNAQKVEAVQSGLQTIGNLAEAFAGKSKASQKKAFQVQKAANIASATIDTYKSATSAFASAGNPILGAVMAAIAVAAGLINIKKISSTTFEGGAGASGGGGSSAPASIPSMNPQTSMFASGNGQANNLSSTNNGLQNQPVIKAVVVESEITASQNKMNKIKESSTL
jgi:hypothetical protein